MLSVSVLCRLLRYNPHTGRLIWRVTVNSRAPAGAVAGYFGAGHHRIVNVCGRAYRASHIVWALQTGEWPPDGYEIDHKDLNPKNNRWDNLRLATRSQNGANRRLQSNNTTGYRGIYLHRHSGKFHARISVGGKFTSLGYFPSAWRAYRAYCAAARKYHGEFARLT